MSYVLFCQFHHNTTFNSDTVLTHVHSAWLSGNCAPDGKRAGSVGILLTMTNVGGVVSGQIYQGTQAPRFTLGHAWSLGCLVVAWFGWWVVRWMYIRRNAAKDKQLAEGFVVPPGEYTDRSAPEFKYHI